MGTDMGAGFGTGIFGMGLGIVVWLSLIAFAVWVAIRLSGNARAINPEVGNSDLPAMAILKSRFAKGEISLEEYKTVRNQLLDPR